MKYDCRLRSNLDLEDQNKEGNNASLHCQLETIIKIILSVQSREYLLEVPLINKKWY